MGWRGGQVQQGSLQGRYKMWKDLEWGFIRCIAMTGCLIIVHWREARDVA